MTNKEIGRRIRARRKELGLTLQGVADKVGVQNSTILRYEKGAIAKIKLPVIEAIASALHVNPDWLMGEADNPDLIASTPISCTDQRIEALEKRIAALELALKNGKDDVELYALVRKPYQPRPSLVKVGPRKAGENL